MKRHLTMHVACLLLTGCLLVPPAALEADVRRDDRRPEDLPDDIGRFNVGLTRPLKGQFIFTGTVLGQDRQAIRGVDVKLFIGGRLIESHVTDPVGQYNFDRTIDFSRDETVVLWFVPPSRALAAKCFVLRESTAATENGLLSPCFTRVQVEPTVETTIYLFDPETNARLIGDKHCI